MLPQEFCVARKQRLFHQGVVKAGSQMGCSECLMHCLCWGSGPGQRKGGEKRSEVLLVVLRGSGVGTVVSDSWASEAVSAARTNLPLPGKTGFPIGLKMITSPKLCFLPALWDSWRMSCSPQVPPRGPWLQGPCVCHGMVVLLPCANWGHVDC